MNGDGWFWMIIAMAFIGLFMLTIAPPSPQPRQIIVHVTQ